MSKKSDALEIVEQLREAALQVKSTNDYMWFAEYTLDKLGEKSVNV